MTVSNVGSATNTTPPPPTDGFGTLFKDFKGIASDIQSGDLTSAQSALTTFQTDLQNNTGKNPLSQLFSNNSTLGNDLTALQTALTAKDSAGATNAFKTLTQDMQSAMKAQKSKHHHHHHQVKNDGDADDKGASATTSSTTSTSGSTASASSSGGTLNVQA